VVGADGHRSTVAALAGAADDRAPNERFGLWAYYRGIPPCQGSPNRIWFLDPDVGIAVRTDDDLTLLSAFPHKRRLAEFQADRAGALEALIASLPDAPDLSRAERVSKVIGMTDYPCVRRPATPRPGVALVGDAAIAGDPLPAVGCGWAFRSAEWLVDATAPALRDGADLARPLARYRRSLRFVEQHDGAARQDARARPANRLERTVRRAAARDPWLARRTYLFAVRAIPVRGLLNPRVLARAVRITARTRATA
jgi:2-polyprenyl-6-methoxyphenol hydroxylase-like FAD-dependent oxidoreductase